jgi:hypothetical protein
MGKIVSSKLPLIPLEGYNSLKAIVKIGGFGPSTMRDSWDGRLSRFNENLFVILAEPENDLLLSNYDRRSDSDKEGGPAVVYELVNKKRENMWVRISQAFFKLSGDGDLRKISFNADQVEDIVTNNASIIKAVTTKNAGGDVFFLIESGDNVYPISISHYYFVGGMFQIRLKNLGDLSDYAGHRERFIIPLI